MAENTKLRFRDAEKGDVPYIKNCGLNAWYAVFGRTDDFSQESFWRQTQRAMSARRDNIQIAMDGDVKAGILIIDSLQRDEPSTAHISLLYLEPSYRGRGLGRQFLDKTVEIARERGLHTVRLSVAAGNKRAVALYTSYGFQCHDQLRAFRRQLTMRYNIPE